MEIRWAIPAIAHVPDLIGESAAQTGQERDPDRTRGALDGHRDLLRDALTQRREPIAQPRCPPRRAVAGG